MTDISTKPILSVGARTALFFIFNSSSEKRFNEFFYDYRTVVIVINVSHGCNWSYLLVLALIS